MSITEYNLKKHMKELTKAEEQVMQILWKLGKGVVNDILNQIDEPKPAYNTVSTIVRILEKKALLVTWPMEKHMSIIH